jgi:phasin
MSRAAKTAETIESASFDMGAATDQFRVMTEKGMEQSREAYARLKNGAEETQKAFETGFETARATGAELSLKTISAMRANAEAAFAHMEALVGVRSVSEFVELQTAFVRKGVEMAVEQAKDMQAVSSKAAEEAAKPVKDVFEKAMRELKVA